MINKNDRMVAACSTNMRNMKPEGKRSLERPGCRCKNNI
jgi:hypothetical protein